jgi:hypothetical protein
LISFKILSTFFVLRNKIHTPQRRDSACTGELAQIHVILSQHLQLDGIFWQSGLWILSKSGLTKHGGETRRWFLFSSAFESIMLYCGDENVKEQIIIKTFKSNNNTKVYPQRKEHPCKKRSDQGNKNVN